MKLNITINKCQFCDYEWQGKPDAKQCPTCKRYGWKKEEKKNVRDRSRK